MWNIVDDRQWMVVPNSHRNQLKDYDTSPVSSDTGRLNAEDVVDIDVVVLVVVIYEANRR
ncbi:hypothetical protein KIN20_027450 [Parelaphostrongylus tenuis]|uniref:Uncharacterized protein n=1 Tax=Parelaphostrongylus tenuis TaxID=148309 RepID=A0AAD5QZK2_PARTN|nr:hypothetical protein KIN20_027447 [Parelaphostrongylus tenuis]KAJ1366702.1 hypothetical protein KIN20_027450 [Parelaphostrongylus tenuis]